MLAAESGLLFPRRAVTRNASAFENNEVVTRDEFNQAVASGAYALWWRAHENGYGIARTIDDAIDKGHLVIVNASRTIIAEARRTYPRLAVVLITAPAGVLAQRLAGRGRASDGDIGDRLQRAALDTDGADLVISNVGTIGDNARKLADFIVGLK
jgi:ribose 1,5-bisphosphokinase